MQIFNKRTDFDFLGKRMIPMIMSVVLIAATLAVLTTRGLNFGLDFTGGTLVELAYKDAVEVTAVRTELEKAGFNDAVVQHFGTTRDVLIRLPVKEGTNSAETSNKLISSLRFAAGESLADTRVGQNTDAQLCRTQAGENRNCSIQVRRIEFVGPQIGDELVDKGGQALIFTLIAVFAYVWFRFSGWKFGLAAIAAIAHDVILVFGLFSLAQIEFDLTVLAALLAVLGYSLNDTIVVFDRIRENFHGMRKTAEQNVINRSINDTLARTIITSGTTLLALGALFVFGGEIIHAFSIALIAGVIVGTYSSIYIAAALLLTFKISREDLMLPEKEGAAVDDMP